MTMTKLLANCGLIYFNLFGNSKLNRLFLTFSVSHFLSYNFCFYLIILNFTSSMELTVSRVILFKEVSDKPNFTIFLVFIYNFLVKIKNLSNHCLIFKIFVLECPTLLLNFKEIF